MASFKKSTWVLSGLAVLGALLVTVGLLDETRKIWFGEARVMLEPASLRPEGGPGSHAFVAAAFQGRSNSPGRPQDSRAELLENGWPLPLAHALHADIRTLGAGRYSHWEGKIYFSTPDNSDPRTNGRRYELVVPRQLPAAVAPCGALLSLFALGWLGLAPLGRKLRTLVANGSGFGLDRRTVGGVAVVFLAALGNSIVWLFSLPPSWNYIDSLVVMLYGIAPGVIPHYPPLYPLFTRTVNYWLTHVFEPHASTVTKWGSDNLSDTSLYGILVLQHLLFATAVTYLACVVARSLRRRLLVVLPFYLAPALSLYNHGIFSEGPWISFLIIVVGAAIQILRSEKIVGWHYLVYFLVWVPALLTRHVSFIFAFILPATLLGLAALERRNWRLHLGRMAGAVIVSLAAWYTVGLMNRVICPWVGVDYHSVYGRSGVYHITMVDWAKVPAESREALIHSIQAKCSSPLVAGAVPVIFANRTPWTGTWSDVNQYVAARGPAELRNRDLGVVTDEILNEVSGLFVRSWNPWYVGRVKITLRDYWTIFRTSNQADGVLSLGEASLELYSRTNQDSFRGVAAVNPDGVACFKAMRTNIGYRLMSAFLDVRLVGLLLVLLVAGAFCRLEKRYYLFCAAAGLNLVIYFVLISLVTTTVTRYALATSIIVTVLLGLILANLHCPPWLARRFSSSP